MGTGTAATHNYGITHIVVGRGKTPWYRRWFDPSLFDRIAGPSPTRRSWWSEVGAT